MTPRTRADASTYRAGQSIAGGEQPLPAAYDGPRACTPVELGSALDLLNLVFRWPDPAGSAAARRPTIGWEYGFVYNAANLDNVRVICHQGQVVSLAAIYPSAVRTPRGTVRVGGVCGVATHPDHRQRGLSTALLHDAAAKMRAGGQHIGLLGTGIPDFYRKLGWERAGRLRTFTFDRRSITYLEEATGLVVHEDWQPLVPQLLALHRDRLPAATRSAEECCWLFERRAGRIFVGSRDGEPVAYAALVGETVREYAGTAADIAALLRCAFATLQTPAAHATQRRPGRAAELTVVTPDLPDLDDGLPAQLRRIGVPASLAYLGMIKLLDVPGLLRSLGLSGLQPQPVGGADQAWLIRGPAGIVEVSEPDLVKLIFGPERLPGVSVPGLPVPFFQWPIDRV